MNDFGRRQIFRAALAGPALLLEMCRSSTLSFEAGESLKTYEVPESYGLYSNELNIDEERQQEETLFCAKHRVLKTKRPKETHILIASETCSFDHCLGRESTWPSPLVPAIRNYKELIKTKWRLVPNLTLNKPYDFITLEEFGKFDRQSFADAYPDSHGCVMLSPVGFNEQKSVAIIFIARAYPGYGNGSLFALEKKDNRWLHSDALSIGCGWGPPASGQP